MADDFSDMLISVLIHDLRQPFATFITTVDMIKHTRGTLSADEQEMIFERMRDTSLKSISLLDGLLCWMKSQKEGFEFETQPLLLNDLIEEANSLYLNDQLNKSITLYNIVPERQLIYAHKQMLQFINRNILSNATKYSPSGGIIGVTCSILEDWITVAFTDQGRGMTNDELEKLFFIHNTTVATDNQLNGAGIALNICRDMICRMNGKLWAESVPGQGCTIYYALPFAAAAVVNINGQEFAR